MSLPDPRRYASPEREHPLLRLAAEAADLQLTAALRELARSRRDADIADALARASSQMQYARIWRALCSAVEKPNPEDAVAARVFAIPWIIVCGGQSAGNIACVLSDVGELARVLELHGVFGGSRNLGLSNVLCGIDELESLAPSSVLSGWQNDRVRNVPPLPIQVSARVEEVHVRFSLGAAIGRAHAADVVETGGNVAAWGTPALRVMAAQLATPGVQLLPMPRPPAGIYTAAYAGRCAALEAAFNLFMSNSVRRFRSIVGDPAITLSSHAGGEVRITLSTAFDDALIEGFRWPLHPVDDLDAVERAITSLISECRLAEPDVRPGVLPDYTSGGAIFFPRASTDERDRTGGTFSGS